MRHAASMRCDLVADGAGGPPGFAPGPFSLSLFCRKTAHERSPYLVIAAGSPDADTTGLCLQPGSVAELSLLGSELAVAFSDRPMAQAGGDATPNPAASTQPPQMIRLRFAVRLGDGPAAERVVNEFATYWAAAPTTDDAAGAGGEPGAGTAAADDGAFLEDASPALPEPCATPAAPAPAPEQAPLSPLADGDDSMARLLAGDGAVPTRYYEKRTAEVTAIAESIMRIIHLASCSRKARGPLSRSEFRRFRMAELVDNLGA